MSFESFEEFLTFIKRKKCPNCGYSNIERHFHKEFLKTARGMRSNNLGYDNYYKSTAVYSCLDCKKSFTLEGLKTGKAIEYTSGLLNEGESKEAIKKRDKEVTDINRGIVSKIFSLISFFMLFLIVSTGIKDKNLSVILIFGSIILLFTLVWMLIVKYAKK